MILIFLLLSLVGYAQVPKINPGTQVKASEINVLIDRLIPIGTIYKSLLTPTQFNAIQGNCWRLMDGSNIASTDLGILTGITSLANLTTSGEFMRQAAGARAVNSLQADAMRNITARTNFSNDNNSSAGVGPNSASGAFFGSGSAVATISDATGDRAGTTHLNFDASRASGVLTATENRPVNIAVNFFIKVNKTCSF